MQVKVLQNAPREHSAILSTFIKLQFIFKIFVLSIFEWPLKAGFTIYSKLLGVIWSMYQNGLLACPVTSLLPRTGEFCFYLYAHHPLTASGVIILRLMSF